MSQAVEEESFYDVPLESMKRKSAEDIGKNEKLIDKKAKIESAEIIENVKIGKLGSHVDVNVLYLLNKSKDLLLHQDPCPFELQTWLHKSDFSRRTLTRSNILIFYSPVLENWQHFDSSLTGSDTAASLNKPRRARFGAPPKAQKINRGL